MTARRSKSDQNRSFLQKPGGLVFKHRSKFWYRAHLLWIHEQIHNSTFSEMTARSSKSDQKRSFLQKPGARVLKSETHFRRAYLLCCPNI